jgi:transcriptional regulator with XRE-family HTH domain
MSEMSRQRKAAHAAKGCTLLKSFQSGLEALRLEADLTRGEFAQSLGIPRSSYFHLMTAAANPSLDYIELIAERAGVEPLALLRKPQAARRPTSVTSAPMNGRAYSKSSI